MQISPFAGTSAVLSLQYRWPAGDQCTAIGLSDRLRFHARENLGAFGSQARVSRSEPAEEAWPISPPRRSIVLKSEMRRAVNSSDCELLVSNGRPDPLLALVMPRLPARMLSSGVPSDPADVLCRLPTHCEKSV